MLLKFETDAKAWGRGQRGPEVKAEAESKILASRPVGPRGFNISTVNDENDDVAGVILSRLQPT